MRFEIKNYLFVALGSLLIALGVVLFFVGNNITTGGAPGMAIVLHHLSGFSIGSMLLAFNIPLLLLGMKYLGKSFGIRTVVAIFLISFFTDIFVELLHVKSITEDIFLATVFGGVVIGMGVGLVLLGNASAGGSTIIARILSAHFEIKAGVVIMAVDACIVLASIYVFADVQKALWSIVSIYVTTRVIDTMLSGGPNQKVVHIASQKVELLSKHISEKLGKEGTILQGNDLFYEKDKKLIFILVKRGKLRLLRQLINEHDSKAVMVVMDASELIGR